MLRRSSRSVLLCLVLASFLTACGGAGSSGAIDRPSITATFSPTRERPTPSKNPSRSPEVPSDSVGPTSSAGPSKTPRPTESAGPTQTLPASDPASGPTSTASSEPTSAPTTSSAPTEAASPTESSSPESGGGSGDEGSDNQAWWWVLVAALVVAAVAALLLLRRSRRKRAWESGLADAEHQAGWFARDLIPQLRGSGSTAGVAGGWTVAAPRVAALDDRLSQLVTTAPGDEQRARAAALQTAVRTARDRVVAVVGAGDQSSTWALDLDDAQAPLLGVLMPPSADAGGASPSAP